MTCRRGTRWIDLHKCSIESRYFWTDGEGGEKRSVQKESIENYICSHIDMCPPPRREESMLDFGLSQEHFVEKIEEKSSDLIANESNREEYERNKDKSRRQLIDFWTDIVHRHAQIIYDGQWSSEESSCAKRRKVWAKKRNFGLALGHGELIDLTGRRWRRMNPTHTDLPAFAFEATHRLKVTFEHTPLPNAFLLLTTWLKLDMSDREPIVVRLSRIRFRNSQDSWAPLPGMDAVKHCLDYDQWGDLIDG